MTTQPNTDRPGPLQSKTWLTIQTRKAQLLITGRGGDGKPAIIGLHRFAGMLRQIWACARQGDPYADWWLVKVDEALQQAQEEIRQSLRQMEARVKKARFEMSSAASVNPLRVPLQFANPYAFRGANLIADYDELVAMILNAGHHALIAPEEQQRLLNLAGRCVRRALSSAAGYKSFGVTRIDMEQSSPKAVEAQDALGVIPADVLSGTRRASLAPTNTPAAAGKPVLKVTKQDREKNTK